ncbi:hypothetical protein FA048_16490 [Pedobacter polaris]|uniref:Uncharacterized protein n=1 Tax=Pedobacter polaris TaxID=2571273 RepID=A0A4U1CHL9_9SPHI|nr:hypothetical protein [Pedobacter polaris]TKC06795.1 hypothetical protein FA048_16490 [Pedobacter polaris]
MKTISHYILRCCCLVFTLLNLGNAVLAQKKIIRTVIPATSSRSPSIRIDQGLTATVSFDLSVLPKDCIIESSSLQFATRNVLVNTAVVLEVYKSDAERITFQSVKTSDTAKTLIAIDIKNKMYWPKSNSSTYAVTLKTTKNAGDLLELYGSPDDAVFEQGFAPKLIINYTEAIVNKVDWGISNANAQHSSQSFMGIKGAIPSGYTVKSVEADGEIKLNLLLFKDNIYLYSNSGIAKVNVRDLKMTKIKTGLVAATETSIPAIDNLGRFYYPNTENVSVIELGNNNNYSDKIKQNGKLVNAITLGADGSVYLPTINSISAYMPFPRNRLIWSYPFSGKKSTITLNEEGTIAYVAVSSNNATGILALDATNGRLISFKSLALKAEGSANLAIPVLDKQGDVYIADKLRGADSLYVFKSNLSKLDKTITGANISIPTAGIEKGVLFIKNGFLMKYIDGNEVKFANMGYNGEVVSLISDQANNIFCLGADKKLYLLFNKESQFKKVENVNGGMALIMGVDGTLYTASNNNLTAIKPSAYTDDYTLVQADFNDDDLTFRGKKVITSKGFVISRNRVITAKEEVILGTDVQVSNATLMIKSAGKISFGKGFLIKKGSEVVVRTEN